MVSTWPGEMSSLKIALFGTNLSPLPWYREFDDVFKVTSEFLNVHLNLHGSLIFSSRVYTVPSKTPGNLDFCHQQNYIRIQGNGKLSYNASLLHARHCVEGAFSLLISVGFHSSTEVENCHLCCSDAGAWLRG